LLDKITPGDAVTVTWLDRLARSTRNDPDRSRGARLSPGSENGVSTR
jgi:DNA invertase Pin-like site-specific DNA recombinase